MPAARVLSYSQFLLLFLIVFFLAAIFTSQFIERGEIVTIPDLAGKTMAEARTDLARLKLSLQEKGVQFSDRYERGRIILQEPQAHSRIRVNKVVRVTLSGGSEMVDVPGLVGRSLEAASRILNDAGLHKGLVSQIHTSQYAAGRIIAQDPPPSSSKVKRNTSVNFLVSQGDVEPRYIMPDLIGKKALPTVSRLNALGFKVADVRYSYYPGLDSGVIIKQFPAHGFGVAKRNLIALEVSR
jgi:serine/threonine-protein kinase